MIAKVIPLKRPRTFTTAEALINELRDYIFASGLTYKTIADKSNVSVTTVNRLANGHTRWPRPTTLFPLIQTLGLEVSIKRK